MRIFVDVDGTITTEQRANSFFKCSLRLDMIAKVRKLYEEGHEIIIWSGTTEYAQRVANELIKNHGIIPVAAIGKPQLIIDNENRKLARRLKKAVVTPEQFLEKDFTNG